VFVILIIIDLMIQVNCDEHTAGKTD